MIKNISKIGAPTLVLCISCLLCGPIVTPAEPIDELDVRSAVETWIRNTSVAERPDASIERLEPYIVDGQKVAFLAHIQGGGFCLCGAYELLRPVYLYSPNNTYDPENPGYRYFLNVIETQLEDLQHAIKEGGQILEPYTMALEERSRLWQELVAGRIPKSSGGGLPRSVPLRIELPMTPGWDQKSPYNDQCPNLTPGEDERVKVGCVATAMSQIMYYWKWPLIGSGSGYTDYLYYYTNDWIETPLADDPGIPSGWEWDGRLNWTADDGGKLRMNGYWDDTFLDKAAEDISDDPEFLVALAYLYGQLQGVIHGYDADFDSAPYQWDLMQDTHYDPPDAGDNETARLCYHAGVSVGMDYGMFASAADSGLVSYALETHFLYDIDAIYTTKSEGVMLNEIYYMRPLHFRGEETIRGGGGHAFVICGYDYTGDPLWKINLGWGGGGDWYPLDQHYPDNQKHVINIAPFYVVRFVGGGVLGDGSPADPYGTILEALAEAPDGSTLIFHAGSVNTFPAESLVIDRPLVLKGVDARIQVQ